ncbi:TetR family transcriptional regulator [Enterobacter sp. FY-07]|uniref:TetR/AcrR family transcriptional regulator n=1 Tax=Kosakonia oryzendophytica TaxID=1005665 RepID=UPI0007772E52|nr:helix-turn-helix domain-containing protein [Kosakonia oryzendophytica]AMO50729.1 TetR family transcriptional regulator [Enterobacter sp. FY-07]WBT57671.1 helix-turn-helix domain containing protein [Kosakonia oryzendophytica]
MQPKTSQEQRHQQRKDEIIAAARRRFRTSGFHAASMSQIALEAQLSVGQIYRYFASKDEIIEEMIRRIIDYRIAEMENKTETSHLPEALAWRHSLSPDDDALMLEMAAEATRNPQVQAMMIEADARMFENACNYMQSRHPHLSTERIRCCVELLAALMEGTTLRCLTPQKCDPTQLQLLYQEISTMLFADK